MRYFDTSFIAPLIVPEASSVRVEKFIRALRSDSLSISHWTRVEFASLVSRRARMREMTREHAARALGMFAEVAGSFDVILPRVTDYDLAVDFLRSSQALRAPDALHLAVARNHGAEWFYTLDKSLLKTARDLGIEASAGISGW